MLYQSHHLGQAEHFNREAGENFSYPLHLHGSFELILVLEGEMTVRINDRDYCLKKDQAVLVFPYQLHSLSSVKSRHVLFIFSGRLVQAFSVKHTDEKPADNRFYPDQALVHALTSLTVDSGIFEKKGVLYSVCGAFDRSARYFGTQSEDNDLLTRIFGFVEQNFAGDCSLKSVSVALGYDYAYLSRFFKQITGIAFNTYVNLVRLNHAGYLLHNTNLTVLECAVESGYRSLRSFNRNFREHYAATPSEYKALK